MKDKIIHFETLGCRLNQDETEGAARSFSSAGFKTDLESVTAKTPENNETVLSVINTCTVTGKAEQKARRIIRLLLEKYPAAPVLVTGCYAELDRTEITSINPERVCILPGTKKYLLAEIASWSGKLIADDFFFTKNLLDEKISGLLKESAAEALPESKPLNAAAALKQKKTLDLNSFTLYTPVFEKHSRASIKIEDGCNNACTFCRIHLARGKAVSLNVSEVLSRIKALENQGMKEVVFTGVNLSQYKGLKDDGTYADFGELLHILLENTESIKFRISSFYPQHITPELCVYLKDPRVQPSFHLSIQSGSDRILSAMHRPYKMQQVMDAVKLLRETKGNPFISCDIIGGFPSESEEDFNETKKLCEEARFGWIHAFPYSPRPGTPAAVMKPQIPERIKGERVKWLTDIAVKGKLDYIKSFENCIVTAIVENNRAQRLGEGDKGTVHAVTANFLHVQCQCAEDKMPVQGSEIKVKILTALEENIIKGSETECTGIIVD